jgi:putative resolvase
MNRSDYILCFYHSEPHGMGLLRPSEACTKYGVSISTLRRWGKTGVIKEIRAHGKHRRYLDESFTEKAIIERRHIAYCRVSSSKQKDDLNRQIESFKKTHPDYEIISDIGSGLNFRRKNLLRMVDAVLCGNVEEIVIAHKDRLCRFSYELISWICDRAKTKLIVQNQNLHTREQELSEDLMAIIHVFSCRHHGMRRYESSKNKTQTKSRTGKNSSDLDESSKVDL